MKRKLFCLIAGFLCFAFISRASAATGTAPQMPADPAIAQALRQVSASHIRANIEKLVSFHTRSTLSANQPASTGQGIVAARDWIRGQFESYSKDCGGCLEVKLDTFTQPVGPRIPQPTEISNVYAVLRGSEAAGASSLSGQRVVLVTGHYDSRDSQNDDATGEAPGANDDGSGTAVSLECARVLSQLAGKKKFRATIIFLTVAGEEQGLYGSKHFAAMAKQNGWSIEAALNNDIVGGNRTPGDTGQNPHTVRVFSEGVPQGASEKEIRLLQMLGGENDSPSRELARYVAEVDRAYLPNTFQPTTIYRADRYLRGGDHLSFNEQGYGAVRFTEWREDFHHQHQDVRVENGIQYGDLPRFVDFDYVANVARLNAATLAELASAPAEPSAVGLQTSGLENDSTLVWNAEPASASAASYEVLWRASDAALWQNAKDASTKQASCGAGANAACKLTLPISKDNVIFAVRALDAAGHPSLPVVPQPVR